MRRYILLALIASGTGVSVRANPDPGVPELAPLAGIVGKWDGTFTVNTNPKETRFTMDAEWVLGGRYVMAKNVIVGENSQSETMTLWTYDVEQKLYRRWFFLSPGGSFQEWGTWDPATKTFTFRGSDFSGPEGEPVPFPDRSAPPPGAKTQSTVKIVDEQTKEWTLQIQNPSGGAVTARGTTKRRE